MDCFAVDIYKMSIFNVFPNAKINLEITDSLEKF